MKPLNGHERRESILKAAHGALAHRGFLGTRARDIATAAGTSVGLLFRYFPTLRELHRAVIVRGLNQPAIRFPRNLAAVRPRLACQAVAAAYLEVIDRDHDAIRLAFFGAMTRVPNAGLLLHRDLRRIRRGITSMIRAWKSKKWVGSEVDPTATSQLVESALMQDVITRHVFGARRRARSLKRLMDTVGGLLEQSGRAVVRDHSDDQWRLRLRARNLA